jgi:hypothetical protein
MHIQYLKDNSGNKTSVVIPLEEWEKFQVELKKLKTKTHVVNSEHLITKKIKAEKKSRPKFGSGKGFFIMAPDFDEPLEDFKEYME